MLVSVLLLQLVLFPKSYSHIGSKYTIRRAAPVTTNLFRTHVATRAERGGILNSLELETIDIVIAVNAEELMNCIFHTLIAVSVLIREYLCPPNEQFTHDRVLLVSSKWVVWQDLGCSSKKTLILTAGNRGLERGAGGGLSSEILR